MTVKSVCIGHEELVKLLTGLSSDVRWLVRIGRWIIGIVVVIMGGFVPVLFNMYGDISSLRERVMVAETHISRMEDRYETGKRQSLPVQAPMRGIQQAWK